MFFVSPKRPELLRPGLLVRLSPEEQQKFLQNPLRSYFVMMSRVFFWNGIKEIRRRFL